MHLKLLYIYIQVAGNLLSILEGQTQTQRVSKVDQSLSTNKEVCLNIDGNSQLLYMYI